MLLNGYTVLSVFLCVTRLLIAVAVVAVGLSVRRMLKHSSGIDQQQTIENRGYLLFLSASVLIALNVVSWPVLYLVLQSYVREWPAIMCIYGVTKIGAGTIGASRFLPALVTTLQWTKPLVVFVSGAGFVLYLINRRTPSGPILNRVLLALLLTGGVTVADSLVEIGYLTIPKSEVRVAGGCCTTTLEAVTQASKFTPGLRVPESQRPYLIAACYALNLAVMAGLLLNVLQPRRGNGPLTWLLYAGALLSIPVSLLYLVEIAAPAILGLPFHHCAYDLISVAPESTLAVGLFLLGCFSVGWSWVAGRFGRCDQTQGFLQEHVARLRFIAMYGYAGAMLLISIEVLLA